MVYPSKDAQPATAQHTSDERLKGAIAYVLGLITGIIVFLIAADNKFLKFHAFQAIIASLCIGIVYWIITQVIGVIFWSSFAWGLWAIISLLLNLLALAIWVYFLYGAYMVYSGKDFKVPYIADFIDKNLMK